jgi:hypothetical protein
MEGTKYKPGNAYDAALNEDLSLGGLQWVPEPERERVGLCTRETNSTAGKLMPRLL